MLFYWVIAAWLGTALLVWAAFVMLIIKKQNDIRAVEGGQLLGKKVSLFPSLPPSLSLCLSLSTRSARQSRTRSYSVRTGSLRG